jgi:dihydrofolate reductase
MVRPERIEGLAIVSADDMIADAGGDQPPALKLEADQRFLFATAAKAGVLVHGRHSGDAGPGAAVRPRIVLTRSVADVARDPRRERRVLWNPAGASLEQAWDLLGARGSLVVIGGTEVFGLFLELGYDSFHVSRAGQARLPGGRPVFPGIPPHTAEALLAGCGLKPGPTRVLDPSHALTLTAWSR